MAQQPTNPRIEELRGRLRADPKSRLFYPLAEELRKIGRYDEAEKSLRDGLAVHSSYLSAWISLGRVLKDTGKYREATEVFGKALQLDMGNVVAARLAADSYLALGEKIEAVKKFKLVRALMPGDQSIVEQIDLLERELHPEEYADVPPNLIARTGTVEYARAAEGAASEEPIPADESAAPEQERALADSVIEQAARSPFEETAAPAAEEPQPETAPSESTDLFETASAHDFDDTSKVRVFPRSATMETPQPPPIKETTETPSHPEFLETAEEATAFEGEEPVSKYGGVVAEPEVSEGAELETSAPSEADFETMIGSTAELEETPAMFEQPLPATRETVEISSPARKADVIQRLKWWVSKVGGSEAKNV